jgi:hypothetical protein
MLIGMRNQLEKTIARSPIETDCASSADAISGALAPMACKPCMMTAKELMKPTNAVSNPIIRAETEKSLNMRDDSSIRKFAWSISPRKNARYRRRKSVRL